MLTKNLTHIVAPFPGFVLSPREVLAGQKITAKAWADKLDKKEVEAVLRPGDHSQFRKEAPRSVALWTSFINPSRFSEDLSAQKRFHSNYVGHAYQELRIKGYELDPDGALMKSENANHDVIATIKAAMAHHRFLGMHFSSAKGTINFFDPDLNVSHRTESVVFKTPLGSLIRSATILVESGETVERSQTKFIPWFKGAANYLPILFKDAFAAVFGTDRGHNLEFFFTEQGDLRIGYQSTGLQLKARFKARDGHGDVISDSNGELRRVRSIQWWDTESLFIRDGRIKHQIDPKNVTALGDFAQGFPQRDHSWDWASFSGVTEDGGKVTAIFEGVRSRKTDGPYDKDGWLRLVHETSDGKKHRYRIKGHVQYEYNPKDLTHPWRVTFHNGSEVLAFLKSVPIGKGVENLDAKVPGMVELDHKRMLARSRLVIRNVSMPGFEKNQVLKVFGDASLESAIVKR